MPIRHFPRRGKTSCSIRQFCVAIVLREHCLLLSQRGQAQEYLTGIKWPEPPIVTPGKTDADPPSDAVVLFDGKDLSAWENGDKWKVEDGVAIVQRRRHHHQAELRRLPAAHRMVVARAGHAARSQGRGNSGVFLMDRYEMQVLDSYDNKTYFDGQAGAIYKQTPPMVNAMRPPGEWNTYDIIWTAPKFKDDGSLEVAGLHHGAAQRRADAQSLRS